LQTTKTKLHRLATDLKRELMPIKHKPFMVFHNGYQYLIKEYNLNLVGIITDNPAAYSSINRIQKAKKQLHDNKVKCVFKEPQFSNKAIETVIANTDTSIGMLDPLGGNIQANKNLYFDLMRHLSNNLLSCLKKPFVKNTKK
jgi:zinc transport system substrate-binding protein